MFCRGINSSVICSWAWRSIMTEFIKYLWFQSGMTMIWTPYLFIVHCKFKYLLWNFLMKDWKTLRRKISVCNLFSSRKSRGQFTLLLLVFYFKFSAVAAGLSCHSLKFRLILFCQKSFLLYPPYGWPLLQALSYHFVFPVTPSWCFHFLNLRTYYKYFLFGTKMLVLFSDGNWEHFSPHS